MKKIIYISFARLTDRVLCDYHIDYLIEKGMSVEYWDIVPMVFKENSDAGMKTTDYLRILRSFNELESMLRLPENNEALYITKIGCIGRFTKIFRMLTKYDCRVVYLAVGARPDLVRPVWWKVLNHLCNPLRLSKMICDIVKVRLYRKLKLVKPFDIIFAAGSVMMSNDRYAAKVVPINLVDYDNYVRAGFKTGKIVSGSYAVYLDTYMPYHNDNQILGRKAVNSQRYYQSLNNFFSLLEKEYGVKVVIAAHPTAEYGAEVFGGRETYRLLTAELVKDADFVLADCSTSVSYAVLNKKPIIFIYTDEMLALYKETIMRLLKALSSYLGSPVYNIDKITRGQQIMVKDINIKCYEEYKYKYLTTPESEHTTTQEILLREINAN